RRQHGAGNAFDRCRAGVDGCRRTRIDKTAMRQLKRDRAEAAAVVRDGRIRHGAHGKAGGRQAPRGHAVDGSAHLRAAASEIELDTTIAWQCYRHLDTDGFVEVNSVIVEIVDVAPGAAWKATQGITGHRLGSVKQELEGI